MFSSKVKLTAEEKLLSIVRVRSGETIREVARSVGVSESTVISWMKTEEKLKLAAEQERYVAAFCRMRAGYQNPPRDEMYVHINSPASGTSFISPQASSSRSSDIQSPVVSSQEHPPQLGALEAGSLFSIGSTVANHQPSEQETVYKKLQEQAVFLHSYFAGLYCFIVQHCGLPDDLKQEMSQVHDPIQALTHMSEVNLFNYYRHKNGDGEASTSTSYNGNGFYKD